MEGCGWALLKTFLIEKQMLFENESANTSIIFILSYIQKCFVAKRDAK